MLDREMIGYPCAVCRRESQGFTFHQPKKPMVQFCSTECTRLYMIAGQALTPSEEIAVIKGGDEAGAYLEKIGKFDLSTMTGPEWETFCQTLFAASCAELRRMADDQVPF